MLKFKQKRKEKNKRQGIQEAQILVDDALKGLPREYEELLMEIRTTSGERYTKFTFVRTDISKDFGDVLKLIKSKKHFKIDNDLILVTEFIESIRFTNTSTQKEVLSDEELMSVAQIDYVHMGAMEFQPYYYNPLEMIDKSH